METLDQALLEAIEFVKSASPFIWGAARQEILARIYVTGLFTLLTTFVSIHFWISWVNNKELREGWEFNEPAVVARCMFSVLATVLAFIGWFIIPGDIIAFDWQVIKLIMHTVPGAGG